MIEPELQNALQELKNQLGSYEKLARVLGVSLLTVRRWLKGESGITYGYECLIRMRLAELKKQKGGKHDTV